MNKRFGILLILCFLWSVNKPVLAAERKALLIGNAAYDVRPLRNPGNDVDGVQRELRKLGFRVTALKNQNRAQMRQQIRRFASQIGSGDEVVFYFSGHGAQVGGQNYLLPIRHDIQQEFEVSDGGVSLNFVLGQSGQSLEISF